MDSTERSKADFPWNVNELIYINPDDANKYIIPDYRDPWKLPVVEYNVN